MARYDGLITNRKTRIETPKIADANKLPEHWGELRRRDGGYPIMVTLAIPPSVLSPNARCHWAKKAKAAKKYRQDAKLATQDAWLASPPSGSYSGATIACRFYYKTNRRRDRDNCLSSIKNGLDGVADALALNDCGFTYLPVQIATDAKRPRVELWITLTP